MRGGRGVAATPCPFGHQRGITYATDTHAHGRVFAYNMSVWVPAYIYFNFYNSDAIPLARFPPGFPQVFPPFSPRFSRSASGARNAL